MKNIKDYHRDRVKKMYEFTPGELFRFVSDRRREVEERNMLIEAYKNRKVSNNLIFGR